MRLAKQSGAVDICFDDVGVLHADAAHALGLSFADIAAKNFDGPGPLEGEARAHFGEREVAWVLEWLADHKARWLPAFRQALANRSVPRPRGT